MPEDIENGCSVRSIYHVALLTSDTNSYAVTLQRVLGYNLHTWPYVT